ncbi:MAG: extracellular solute-binding protein [Treponema sp.]|nr:extracellular solute-binding protein [Treponema sp.]
MKNAKTIIIPVMVLTVCLAFTACRRQQGNPVYSKELNVVYSGTPQPHEKEFIIEVFIKNFENKYKVKVNIEFISQTECIKKIQNEQNSKNFESDVIFVDTANMAPYVNGRWMIDLSSMVYAGSTFTAMYDGITRKGGEYFFVPACFDIYVLAAKVDALKYLPAELAKEDVLNGITWEAYAQWAVNIAQGEGVGKTMMPANDQGSQLVYPMAGMGMAYGGGFPDFTSAGFKNALGIIAAMAEGNAFYPKQDQYTAPTKPMQNGEVWLTFAHISPIGIAYVDERNHWLIGPAPKGIRGSGSTSGAWCWGVQKGAPHEDLAALWIEYVTTPHVNYQMCSQLSFLSPIKEIAPLLGTDDAVMAAGNKMLTNTVISSVPSTQYKNWDAVKLLYHDVFNQTVNAKQIPSDAFLRDLETKCQALRN